MCLTYYIFLKPKRNVYSVISQEKKTLWQTTLQWYLWPWLMAGHCSQTNLGITRQWRPGSSHCFAWWLATVHEPTWAIPGSEDQASHSVLLGGWPLVMDQPGHYKAVKTGLLTLFCLGDGHWSWINLDITRQWRPCSLHCFAWWLATGHEPTWAFTLYTHVCIWEVPQTTVLWPDTGHLLTYHVELDSSVYTAAGTPHQSDCRSWGGWPGHQTPRQRSVGHIL